MTILVDFESRSRADLRRIGGRAYWRDPSTEVLCAVLADLDTPDVNVWIPGDPCPVRAGVTLAAHNASGFDRFAAARAWGVEFGGRDWIDTSELARRAGLPGALDALGTRWLGRPKDAAGSRFTLSLSSVRRPPQISPDAWRRMSSDVRRIEGRQPDVTPEARARVIGYCASDVEIMAHGWPLLRRWADVDADALAVDRVINDRGVGFDAELAQRLLVCDARNADLACSSAARILRLPSAEVRTLARSPAQFTEALAALGAPVADAQKGTLEDLLSVPTALSAGVRALIRARSALATIARGKLEAGLARSCPDGRLRDAHRYYGAHTGRWSGRGMQLQNLPRPAARFDHEDMDALAERVRSGEHADADTVDALVRGCLVARPGCVLAVCDFSGVEARALAWCAGDHGALEVFASGRDPYRVAAARLFGCEYDAVGKGERRQVGKIAELACGYGMGAGELSKRYGALLASAGVRAEDVIDSWRRQHAPVVRFWRAAEVAFHHAVQGRRVTWPRFAFEPADDGVSIVLPSGRPVEYPRARIEGGEIRFESARGTGYLYGGKIVENMIQALCRDLLADALIRAERAGLAPVFHVHDEIVCEVDTRAGVEAYRELHAIMTSPPKWAHDFPAAAAGYHAERFRK